MGATEASKVQAKQRYLSAKEVTTKAVARDAVLASGPYDIWSTVPSGTGSLSPSLPHTVREAPNYPKPMPRVLGKAPLPAAAVPLPLAGQSYNPDPAAHKVRPDLCALSSNAGGTGRDPG